MASDDVESSDLEDALAQFDRVDANIKKLEDVLSELREATGPEREDLVRSFCLIAEALPAIEGFRIDALPMSEDEIVLARVEASEVGEASALMAVEEAVEAPETELGEYRFRFNTARRTLVREQVAAVVAQIDRVLGDAVVSEGMGRWRSKSRWGELEELLSQLSRLVGRMVPRRPGRWGDLFRHLRFAEANDLADIVNMDWPSVRAQVESNLYDAREPVPVNVDDLGALVRSRPKGPVSTGLPWERLTDEEFERLLFELVRQADGYENANWLMHTNAPDRGRDVEVIRVVEDTLGGTSRYRVIVQCKHWLKRSVGRIDLITCLESVKLWEPPRVDVLIVATSGRFSQDAVAVAEKRNEDRAVPRVELWSDSHLESLLSRRPYIAASFGLR